MAICSYCGTVMHEEDIQKHTCKDKPIKGKEWKPVKTVDDVI